MTENGNMYMPVAPAYGAGGGFGGGFGSYGGDFWMTIKHFMAELILSILLYILP